MARFLYYTHQETLQESGTTIFGSYHDYSKDFKRLFSFPGITDAVRSIKTPGSMKEIRASLQKAGLYFLKNLML